MTLLISSSRISSEEKRRIFLRAWDFNFLSATEHYVFDNYRSYVSTIQHYVHWCFLKAHAPHHYAIGLVMQFLDWQCSYRLT